MKFSPPVMIGVVVLSFGIAGLAFFLQQKQPDNSAEPISKPDKASIPASAKSTNAEPELAGILANEKELERVHQLARWGRSKTPEQIHAAMQSLSPEHRQMLHWLLHERQQELHPDATEEQLYGMMGDLLGNQVETWESDSYTPGKPDANALASMMSLAVSSPDAAVALAKATPMHPDERERVLLQLVAKTAEHSPEAALKLADSHPQIRWSDAVSKVLDEWVVQDPKAALAWMETLPPSAKKDALLYQFIQNLAEQDLEAAVDLAVERNSQGGLSNVYSQWFAKDPEAAAKRIMAEPYVERTILQAAIEAVVEERPELAAQIWTGAITNERVGSLGKQIMNRWVEKDPAAALAWMNALPSNRTKLEIAAVYAGGLAQKDLAAAKTYLDSLPPGVNKGAMEVAVASAMDNEQDALSWLSTRAGSSAVASRISNMIADKDVDSILAMAGSGGSPSIKSNLYRVAAEKLAKDSPTRALQLLTTLRDEGFPLGPILSNVVDPLAEKSPDALMQFALGLSANQDRQRLMHKLTAKLNETDPTKSVEWLLQFPGDGSDVRYSLRRSMETLGTKDPDEAIRWYANVKNEKLKLEAMRGLINGAALRSPQEAANLIQQHGDPEIHAAIYSSVAKDWSAVDLKTATNWAGTLPMGKAKDAVLSGLAESIVKGDPAAAKNLLPQASSPEARSKIADHVIRQVRQMNKAEIEPTIRGLPISPAEQDALILRYIK